MARAGEVSVAFTAETNQFEANVKRSGKTLDGFKGKVNESKGTLENLKKGLGEDSKFGGFFKILSGAGAVAGLTVAGHVLNGMADKITEVQESLRNGAHAGDIAEDLAKSIPIFGGIIEAGRKFRAQLDGSAEATRKITVETDGVNSRADYALARFKMMTDETTGLAAQLRKVNDEIKLIGAAPAVAAAFGRQTGARDEKEAAKKAYEADRDAARASAAKAKEDTDKEYNEKLKALQDANDYVSKYGGRKNVKNDSNLARNYDAAKDQFAGIEGVRQTLSKQINTQLETLESKHQKTIADIDVKYAKQKAEDDKKFGDERIANQQRILDRLADTEEKRLQSLEYREADGQAERLRIVREADAQIADVAKKFRDHLIGDKDSNNEIKAIADERDRALAESARKEKVDVLQRTTDQVSAAITSKDAQIAAEQEIENARVEAAKKAHEDILDVEQETQELRLNREGKALEAQTARIEFETEKRKKALREGFNGPELDRALGAEDELRKQKLASLVSVSQSLPTAVQRRFDFSIPGSDVTKDPVVKAIQQLITVVKANGSDGRTVADAMGKLVSQTASKVFTF